MKHENINSLVDIYEDEHKIVLILELGLYGTLKGQLTHFHD